MSLMEQASNLSSQIKEENNGKLDVLINNAGINTQPEHSPDSVKKTLDTNYRGTLNMCQTFLPLVSSSDKQGRIVNISSVGSSLHIYGKAVQQRFRDSNMTLKDLEQLAQEYQSAVEAGEEEAKGFGGKGQSYSVSKACVNALTAILARESKDKVLSNACCPGWVDTDMGGILGKPPKAPSDGAKIPVRLAFGDIGATTGRYWANPGISDTGDGQVMER
ncbi:hypothetical protein BDV97DRAFT_54145 [Delphinella strobiligena]|nr:hypothetical protein BDV97DRAFT_54145 [Delphinella strobiligena]